MERKLEEIEVQKRDLEKRREQLEHQFQQERRAKLRELDSRLDDTLRQYANTWEQSLEELRRQAVPAKVVSKGERKATGLVREAKRGMEQPGSASAGRTHYDVPRAFGGAADGRRRPRAGDECFDARHCHGPA